MDRPVFEGCVQWLVLKLRVLPPECLWCSFSGQVSNVLLRLWLVLKLTRFWSGDRIFLFSD